MVFWCVNPRPFRCINGERCETVIQEFPEGAIQIATTDHWKEFSCSSWQRGSNENGNGLLREFFPKKTNFDYVTEQEMEQALHLINNRPRKCLGWKTAYEAFEEELLHFI